MKSATRKRNRTKGRPATGTAEPAKGLTLPNGNRLSRGQLFTPKEGNPMTAKCSRIQNRMWMIAGAGCPTRSLAA